MRKLLRTVGDEIGMVLDLAEANFDTVLVFAVAIICFSIAAAM